MIHYFLQIVAFQLLFLTVYDLFLKKETFFTWNRVYLLLTPILSIVLPLVKIELIRESIPEEFLIELPAVILGGGTATQIVPENMNAAIIGVEKGIEFGEIWQFIWLGGMLISLCVFGYKLLRIARLRKSGVITVIKDVEIVLLPKTDSAFSFFNTIFMGELLSEGQRSNILLHEKIHIDQRHSIDLLFFELMRIIFWFNPLVYIFQSKMILLQEFTADACAAAQNGKKAYYEELLAQVFKTESISFINTFFNQSLIKKRIVMLQKSRSKKIFQLKYLLLLPMVSLMIVYTSCAQDSKSEENVRFGDTNTESKSEIIQNIETLKESIAAKGEMTEEEEIAFKSLVVLTSEEGMNNMYFDDVKDQIDIHFGVIQKVPTYPGCTGDNETLKKCFKEKIMAFVGQEFNVKVSDGLPVSGRQRIVVNFKISNKGMIEDVTAEAAYAEFKAEAIRVINELPEMLPGEHDGKKVAVQYALPIVFDIAE